MRTKALAHVFAAAVVLLAASPAFARQEMRGHVCDPRVENCRVPSFETCGAGQNCMSRLRAPGTNSYEWPNNLILD
jgi:hypothetical protein